MKLENIDEVLQLTTRIYRVFNNAKDAVERSKNAEHQQVDLRQPVESNLSIDNNQERAHHA